MKNKNFTLNRIAQIVKTITVFILLMFIVTRCGTNQAASSLSIGPNQQTCASLGFDWTPSFKDHRQLDTSFVSTVCHLVSMTGGLVVVYSIDEPTDLSGIRCYLESVPRMDPDLVLSRQAELKQKINFITASNEKKIQNFIKKVQKQIFLPRSNSNKYIKNSDINGFFKKIAVLLDEPQIQKMTNYVFCYSDGIQSLNGNDSPANFYAKPKSKFTLCLSGWKTKLPCDSVEIERFEDPEGFLQYLSSNYSLNH